MRTLGHTIIALLAGAAIAHAQTGAVTFDPAAHLRSIYDMTGVSKIYKLEVDVNGDGRNEVFLSPLEADDDEQNLGWYLYIARPTGDYILAGAKTDTGIRPESLAIFNKTQYLVGQIAEIGQRGLLRLQCGRGGQAKCQLLAIVIEGDAFKEVPIGQSVSAEENYDQLSQRFPQTPTPAVQELTP